MSDPSSAPPYPPIPVEEPRVSLGKVQSIWTGYLGLVVLFLGLGLLAFGFVPKPNMQSPDLLKILWLGRHAILLAVVGLAMIAYELLIVKVHRRHFDFSDPRTVGDAARQRILRRTLGLFALLLTAWVCYTAFDLYRLDRYLLHVLGVHPERPQIKFWSFFQFFVPASIAAAVVGPFYFWMTEKYARDEPADDPDDEMLLTYHVADDLLRVAMGGIATSIGRLAFPPALELRIRERLASDYARLKKNAGHPNFKNTLRWGFVKFFFLPWMMVWFLGNCGAAENHARGVMDHVARGELSEEAVVYGYRALLNVVFLVDLAFATLGYMITVKLLDTHVKSADATMLGWAVAIGCYPPFNATTRQFITHGGDAEWLSVLGGGTVPMWLFIVWGIVVLILLGIYSWATVIFGMRFSNLTNRGIICTGPYAIVRHPAYITKNLSWWLMSVPFLRHWLPVAGLIGWNIVYFLRAYTEEKHLRQDPHYREYCQKVRWKFIPGVW